jgi:molybdopterin-guanine dinucleotide biosynthesis protein
MPLAEVVRRFLWDADIVLAEGFKSLSEPKLEIHRKGTHPGPLFDPSDPASAQTLALVTDDSDLKLSIPSFPLDGPEMIRRLADLVEEAFRMKARRE